MSSSNYNFAIVGAGAAGLHLALAMQEDPWFREKKILVIDKDPKNQNDRTWCFWEKKSGKWDHLIQKSWEKGQFINTSDQVDLQLLPYRYKMLHAIDFYDFAKKQLSNDPRFDWVRSEVQSIDSGFIHCDEETYNCQQIFDSRIDPDYLIQKDKFLNILQHFKGWYIKTEKPAFDENSFVMMDYRLKYENQTSFMYVLPTSATEALIEYTFFTPELVHDSVYDDYLRKYISDYLNIDVYTIEREEKGVIPMTNYPFHKHSNNGLTKIGTAGSWVKPSSGYSFKNSERMVDKVIRNLKKGTDPSRGLISKRFRYYDALFLDILNRANQKGEELFTSLYTGNSIQSIMEFLDEESSFSTDLKIFSSLPSAPFIKSLFRSIF